jgi:hypothetical protein
VAFDATTIALVARGIVHRVPGSYRSGMNWAVFPGGDLVSEGLADLAAGRLTAAAALVSIGAPRLTQLGIGVPAPLPDPEHQLYHLLAGTDEDTAHARFNALVRRLVSFERALACVR